MKTQFRIVALASAALIAAASVGGSASAAPPKPGISDIFDSPNGIYIVRMSDAPAVAYKGGIPGYKATAPRKGQKIDPLATEVVRYNAYLDSKHDAVLASIGAAGRKVASYRFAYNGFAAKLTSTQANALKRASGVLDVQADEARALDTSSTPGFLGLPGGLWSQSAGGSNIKGENVIIGIVDGGIWPESLSFSDRTGENGNATKDGKLSYQQIPGWHGRCVPGEEFNASNCNQKLIGAQYFNAGWGGNAGIDAQLPWEYNSPRDFGGHGTHTASTAGGNQNVPTTGAAEVFSSISGIAPRARISAYKVCWQTATGGSCFSSDSVAAIDQAVADGVDVINFSISGSRTNFRDAVEIAFMYAADAGVFVAASAGNSGPTSSTVAHPGPWLTTVAASTHNRSTNGIVTLGNAASYVGPSAISTNTGVKPLIDSVNAGLAGANAAEVEFCVSGTLDPAKVTGKIVLCKRGSNARIDKSLAVQMAGGVGMVLYNPTANSLNADLHFVPTVHVDNVAGPAIKTYILSVGAAATAQIAQDATISPFPVMAAFSSRGPLRASGDLLKPDLTAPGVDILAAVAPPGNYGRSFDLYSGTSMSSPHVAGLAALLKQAHPSWSPAAIKSALMTTGYDVLDAVSTATKIFRQGAGHVRPNLAADPGLVFDAGWNDWIAFICATQPSGLAALCASYPVIDPSNFNVASIAIGDLAGVQTVTRKVTNVGLQTETYSATLTGLAGFTVNLPPTFTIAPGATVPFNVGFTTAGAALNSYVGGQLTLTGSGGSHVVRIPVVIRPVALAAPTSVSTNVPTATLSYSVTFGYNGPFTAVPRGLIPAAVTPGTVADDPTDGACSLTSPNKQLIPVVIPAGTTYARFSLFDADVNPGSDIDLCVFSGATLVGSSGSGTSTEEVNLTDPAAGNYTVVVQGWGVVGSSPFKLHTWLLGTADDGNMAVTAPAAATIGTTGAINLTFSGLAPATKYLGSVAYSGIGGLPNPTIVRVDTP